jgi:AcrR family transcriptional regulator
MSCQPGCPLCERLRAAALELIGRGGLEGLTLYTLSERAGCSVEEVRDHYATEWECLLATHDEVSFGLFLELASGFAEPGSWECAVVRALRRLLARLAANPAEARLCFVEALRGDRRLRGHCAKTRVWAVELFANEYRRRRFQGESALQIELLVGAAVQAIAGAVGGGRMREPHELECRLAELPEVFTPIAA